MNMPHSTLTASPTLLSPAETDRLRGAPEAVLLDVRTPLERREVHISGTRPVPLDTLVPAALAAEVGDRKAVLICRSGTRARQAAARLAAAGCRDLAVLDGGLLAWQAAGLPVNRGTGAMSLERQVRIAAGVLVLAGAVLGALVHPGFHALSAFVGGGLIFAGVTDRCGMGLLLARAPWNRVSTGPESPHSTDCCAH